MRDDSVPPGFSFTGEPYPFRVTFTPDRPERRPVFVRAAINE